MTTMTDTTRVYVASLSDYNSGRLHGVWIDLADCGGDIDVLWEKVNAMLAASPEQAQTGWKAEEWAIHDYEGFGGIKLSEYESFDTVLMLADLIEEKGLAFAAWYDNESRTGMDAQDLAEGFDEAYAGEWGSEKDYAYEYVDECGWGGIEGSVLDGMEISSYLDWDMITRDLFMDYWSAKTPEHNVWVFRNG
jgi:antirestriction protein